MLKNDVIVLSFVALFLVFLIVGINYTGFSINAFEQVNETDVLINNSNFDEGDIIINSTDEVILRYNTNNVSNCSLQDLSFDSLMASLYSDFFDESYVSFHHYDFVNESLNDSLDINSFIQNYLLDSDVMSDLIFNISNDVSLQDLFLATGYYNEEINIGNLYYFFEKTLVNMPHEFELSCVDSVNESNSFTKNFNLTYDYDSLNIKRFENVSEFSFVDNFNYSFDTFVLINDIKVFGSVKELNVTGSEYFDCEINEDNFIFCENVSELKPVDYEFSLEIVSPSNRVESIDFFVSVYKNKTFSLENFTNMSFDDLNLSLNFSNNFSESVNVSFHLKNKNLTKSLDNKLAVKSIVINSNEINELFDWVILYLNYSEDELSENIDEESLKLYYYNESLSGWEVIEDSFVDTDDNFVIANITHFSEYGIFGDVLEEETTELYYRFEDNECDEIYLYLGEVTSDDYDTLSECEDEIVEEENTTNTTSADTGFGVSSVPGEQLLEEEVDDNLNIVSVDNDNLISIEESYVLNHNFQTYAFYLTNIDSDSESVSLFFEDLLLTLDLYKEEPYEVDLDDNSQTDFIFTLVSFEDNDEVLLHIKNYNETDSETPDDVGEGEGDNFFDKIDNLLFFVIDILVGIIFLLGLALLIKRVRSVYGLNFLSDRLRKLRHIKKMNDLEEKIEEL